MSAEDFPKYNYRHLLGRARGSHREGRRGLPDFLARCRDDTPQRKALTSALDRRH